MGKFLRGLKMNLQQYFICANQNNGAFSMEEFLRGVQWTEGSPHWEHIKATVPNVFDQTAIGSSNFFLKIINNGNAGVQSMKWV